MNLISGKSPSYLGDYAFLRQLPDWYLLQVKHQEKADLESIDLPLRAMWVNDSETNYLFTSIEKPFEYMGLEIDWTKPFPTSKRIKRGLRSYNIYRFYPSKINIQFVEDKKLWDGAGLVSRKFLKTVHIFGHNERKTKALKFDLKHAERVEFTIITDAGMYKGHAMVVDDDSFDFLIPDDCKKEIKSINSKTFVGINPVHGSKTMLYDSQSMINLYPFFNVQYLHKSLVAYINAYLEKIADDDYSFPFMGLSATQLVQARNWPVLNYLIRGGKPTHSPFVVKSLIKMLIKEISSRSGKSMRIPVYGGRYYICPEAMASEIVQRGQALIDHKKASIIIPNAEWNLVSSVLGGADMDDGCWVIPFIDYDGQTKVLYWRSPNQQGEYMVSLLDTRSELPTGTMPTLDSRTLPERIDRTNKVYLAKNDDTDVVRGTKEFSFEVMQLAQNRAKMNAGVLGTYVNTLMTLTVIGYELDVYPKSLEDVIDGSVKTGANQEDVKKWCPDIIQHLIDNGYEFPRVMTPRFIGSVKEEFKDAIQYKEYWIDEMASLVNIAIAQLRDASVIMENQCTPHSDLIPYMPAIESGAVLRQIHQKFYDEKSDRAYREVLHHLRQIREDAQDTVLLGCALSAFTNVRSEKGAVNLTDATLWLSDGAKNPVDRDTSIGSLYVRALVKAGILGKPLVSKGQVIGMDYEDTEKVILVHGNGTFFNVAAMAGVTPDELKKDKEQADHWKAFVGQLCKTTCDTEINGFAGFINAKVYCSNANERFKLYMDDELLCYVTKGEECRLESGKTYEVTSAIQQTEATLFVLRQVENG